MACLLLFVQRKDFLKEISYFEQESSGVGIKQGLQSSKIRSLNPFIKTDRLLWVGGRVGGDYEFPHPIILP